ncbi:MAG: aminopeptidase N [Bacteriovoracaceae bacterium]|jgi:aminopeptidase N
MGTFKVQIILILALFLNASCTTTNKKASNKVAGPVLSQQDAIKRSKKVSKVKYELNFNLSDKSKKFSGSSRIKFQLSDNSSPLRIDFHKGKIFTIIVNGKISKIDYNNSFISINEMDLLVGMNKVEIDFEKEFSTDGSGLYRFVDLEDKRVYTYSDLEPYDANKVFPCFDQPNLKATYKMQVLAPSDWSVITSVIPSKSLIHKNKTKTWFFPESALFSTYIWSLHAGPYHSFNDVGAKYPSRLFVRQSMKKYVNLKDWQTFTRQSFDFLDEYFGYPYPYKKYDQIIVPDFNAGAMENVAAVTFSERFISRGIKTEAQRRKLANVIFHEMAHMWFGNLVTMDWWNDLWLNESFATYIANLGLSRNTEFKSNALRDFNGTKQWAYWEDQLVTTHPIEANVPDTSQAFANFDGITYGKGAASLKQIHYFLGEKQFKEGLQIYFKRHANKNTKLVDFITALQDGSNRDLKKWQKLWLQTKGVNTISAKYTCSNNKIDSFQVEQSAPEHLNYLRPHSFKVALLNMSKNKLKVSKTFKVHLINKSKDISEIIGYNCPDIVYPNFEDHDYLMVNLDKRSIRNLELNINKISSPFLRQLLWSTLWNMVYYARYDYKKYTDLVIEKSLKVEQDDIVLGKTLDTIHGKYSTGPSIQFYASNDMTVSSDQFKALSSKVESAIWDRLSQSKPKSEVQKILFKSFLSAAHSKVGFEKLKSILSGKTIIKGIKIDQDKRWSIISKLSSYGIEEADKLVKDELKIDLSNSGKKMKIRNSAIRPIWKNKKHWLEELKKDKTEYSYAQIKSVIYSLFPRDQKDLRIKYSTSFFKDMDWVIKNKDSSFAATFTSLAPNDCSKKSQKSLLEFIHEHQGIKAKVLKKLKIIHQENKRCMKVLNLASSK